MSRSKLRKLLRERFEGRSRSARLSAKQAQAVSCREARERKRYRLQRLRGAQATTRHLRAIRRLERRAFGRKKAAAKRRQTSQAA